MKDLKKDAIELAQNGGLALGLAAGFWFLGLWMFAVLGVGYLGFAAFQIFFRDHEGRKKDWKALTKRIKALWTAAGFLAFVVGACYGLYFLALAVGGWVVPLVLAVPAGITINVARKRLIKHLIEEEKKRRKREEETKRIAAARRAAGGGTP